MFNINKIKGRRKHCPYSFVEDMNSKKARTIALDYRKNNYKLYFFNLIKSHYNFEIKQRKKNIVQSLIKHSYKVRHVSIKYHQSH